MTTRGDDTLALQMLDRLDDIKRDVGTQSTRIERLATTQEMQAKELDRLNTNVEQVRAELPKLNGIVQSHKDLKASVIEHDRKLHECTGRIETLTSRQTPRDGYKRPSLPPRQTPMEAIKDWSNIIKWIAWAAILSASIVAGFIAADRVPSEEKEKAPALDTDRLLEELKKLQSGVSNYTPAGDERVTHFFEVDND